MTVPVAFMLLLEPALRAGLLGGLVWVLLRATRVRDTQAEIMIWTAVLVASLAMPLLTREMPAGLTLPWPSFSVMAPVEGNSLLVPQAGPAVTGSVLAARIPALLWDLYVLVAVIGLARIAAGLLLTLRLYRKARPVAAPWAAGRAIRTSTDIVSPVSFGRCILLPPDCRTWPSLKLEAVLAHEQSHVRRGDFFILLLAGLHRAVFWFSPFAWWLQWRLSALAEVASDEAAIQALNDRASYAEILIDVSRRARQIPAQVAMAKGPNVFWRVDRILKDVPASNLSMTTRLTAVSAILPAACLIAAAHAAVMPAQVQQPAITAMMTAKAAATDIATPMDRPVVVAAAPRGHAKIRKAPSTRAHADYNPRALLEDNDAVIVKAVIPVDRKGARKKSGDAAVILNLTNPAGD